MEVTPIDLRGVHVSSGDGATPHGRDMSPPKEETNKPRVGDVTPRREIPFDIAQEHLAVSLRKAAPMMDPSLAMKIAKSILGSDAGTGEKKVPAKTSDTSERQVDFKA